MASVVSIASTQQGIDSASAPADCLVHSTCSRLMLAAGVVPQILVAQETSLQSPHTQMASELHDFTFLVRACSVWSRQASCTVG